MSSSRAFEPEILLVSTIVFKSATSIMCFDISVDNTFVSNQPQHSGTHTDINDIRPPWSSAQSLGSVCDFLKLLYIVSHEICNMQALRGMSMSFASHRV